ncbi:MAG: hypothetical protein M0D55_05145 [Elusimicrobiota bacterium]|nr:MAG: hypothetical protein M0D55_05145 [Elusimicrobiota bacterium]
MMRAFLAALLLLSPLSSFAQVARVPVLSSPLVPAFRGPVISELNAQLKPLLAAETMPQLKAAFATGVVPTPAAATPAAFAARAAIVQAMADPKAALPQIVSSLQAAGGPKAQKAAARLQELGAMLESPKAAGVIASAAALNARFDGATALPGESVDLSRMPTNENGPSEKKTLRRLRNEVKEANKLEDMLAAAKTQAVLVVLQGMDTAGKDGAIKHGMTGLNPAWTRVSAFKKPSAEEARQDFLERIRKEAPKPGIIGVFNRSHYEDIAVPTVYGTHSPEEVAARYAKLVAFERELAERGVKVVKIFLHVSKDVQRERLQRRIDRPDKRWKFAMADLETRKKWDEFQKAYGAILARTSTYWAPWNVIPADDKPRRDRAFARLLRKAMQRMGLAYPPAPDRDGIKIPK